MDKQLKEIRKIPYESNEYINKTIKLTKRNKILELKSTIIEMKTHYRG